MPPSSGPANPPNSAARDARATALPYAAGGHFRAAKVSSAGTAAAPTGPCRARINISVVSDGGHHWANCTRPCPTKPISSSQRAGNRSRSQPYTGAKQPPSLVCRPPSTPRRGGHAASGVPSRAGSTGNTNPYAVATTNNASSGPRRTPSTDAVASESIRRHTWSLGSFGSRALRL